jgi:hypothetical protein
MSEPVIIRAAAVNNDDADLLAALRYLQANDSGRLTDAERLTAGQAADRLEDLLDWQQRAADELAASRPTFTLNSDIRRYYAKVDALLREVRK